MKLDSMSQLFLEMGTNRGLDDHIQMNGAEGRISRYLSHDF